MSAGQAIDSKSIDDLCGACGVPVVFCDFSAIYIPAGTSRMIPYRLCLWCSGRLRAGEAAKQEIWAAVELRLGPMRGAA